MAALWMTQCWLLGASIGGCWCLHMMVYVLFVYYLQGACTVLFVPCCDNYGNSWCSNVR